jgi:hypothetical protein
MLSPRYSRWYCYYSFTTATACHQSHLPCVQPQHQIAPRACKVPGAMSKSECLAVQAADLSCGLVRDVEGFRHHGGRKGCPRYAVLVLEGGHYQGHLKAFFKGATIFSPLGIRPQDPAPFVPHAGTSVHALVIPATLAVSVRLYRLLPAGLIRSSFVGKVLLPSHDNKGCKMHRAKTEMSPQTRALHTVVDTLKDCALCAHRHLGQGCIPRRQYSSLPNRASQQQLPKRQTWDTGLYQVAVHM